MRRLRMALAACLAVALAAVMGYALLGPYLDGRILPGTSVWSVPLGGLTPPEAVARLAEASLDGQPSLRVEGPEGRLWAFSPRELGLSLDAAATVQAAYAPGHENLSRWNLLAARLRLLLVSRAIAPQFVWDEDVAWSKLQTVAAAIDCPPQDAAVRPDGEGWAVAPARYGRRMVMTATLAALEPLLRSPDGGVVEAVVEPVAPQIDDEAAAWAVEQAEGIVHRPLELLFGEARWTFDEASLRAMVVIRPQEHGFWVGLDEAAMREALAPIAAALRRAPVDARFHFDETSGTLAAFAEAQEGQELDLEATIAQIERVVQSGGHRVPLIVRAVEPRYVGGMSAASLGIRETIAVGESYFTGSSSARDHNIRVGAARFDGVIIAPGETFSFNALLGDVTLEEGYEQAYVIVGERTVQGVGGGLCQVATTAFRAAFYAGYPILERWPHAYRVRYYELGGYGPGFDATIYAPQLDLRFVNDSPYPLLIHTEVDKARSRLRFVFYSTPDGRTVEQIGPTWGKEEPPPPPVYEYDPSLPSGTVRQVERAKPGLTAVLERIVRDSEGLMLYHDRFVSHFLPWPARYRFGPGFVPPPEATVIGGDD